MSTYPATDPRASVKRSTGGVKLTVPFVVDGVEYKVDIGIQPTSTPLTVFDGAMGAQRFRDALGVALTKPVPVSYGKSVIEKQLFPDILADAIVGLARATA